MRVMGPKAEGSTGIDGAAGIFILSESEPFSFWMASTRFSYGFYYLFKPDKPLPRLFIGWI